MKESDDRLQTTKVYTNKRGVKRCAGSRDLKKTQSYPLSFGASHALAYDQCLGDLARKCLPGLELNPEDTDTGSDLSGDECLEDLKSGQSDFWDSNVARERKLSLGDV